MSRKRSASMAFIFTTILIDAIGIGIIIPVVPDLIRSMMDGGYSEASAIGGWLMFAYSSMQFAFAPLLGALSDKYGRRPIILLALFGLGVDYLFHYWAPTLTWLFVGRVLGGITGASFTVATAYIADISTPEKKAQNFGMVGAAFGLGFILGPGLGGVVGEEFGVRSAFLVAAGLSFLNLLYGLLVLPESLPADKRRKPNLAKANPLGSLMGLNKHSPYILAMVVAFFLVHFAGYAVQATWSFFTMQEFQWSTRDVGWSLALVGLIVAIVQGGLIRFVVKYLGEQRTVLVGMTCWFLGLLGFGLSSTGTMMLIAVVPYCLGGVAGPTIQGIISNRVPVDEQGEMQGTLTSMISVAAIISPIVMTAIFYYFAKEPSPDALAVGDAITTGNNSIRIPGMAFLFGALLVAIAYAVMRKPLSKLLAEPVPEAPSSSQSVN